MSHTSPPHIYPGTDPEILRRWLRGWQLLFLQVERLASNGEHLLAIVHVYCAYKKTDLVEEGAPV